MKSAGQPQISCAVHPFILRKAIEELQKGAAPQMTVQANITDLQLPIIETRAEVMLVQARADGHHPGGDECGHYQKKNSKKPSGTFPSGPASLVQNLLVSPSIALTTKQQICLHCHVGLSRWDQPIPVAGFSS